MALSGSLSDLNILDLIQFPITAGRTGELIVAGLGAEARLYYSDGQLCHAACDANIGMDAIAQLMSFSEGEFEFRVDVSTPEKSIHIPFKEIIGKIMTAQNNTENHTNADNEAGSGENPLLQHTIADTARKHNYIEHVALFTTDAALICKWDRDKPDASFEASIHQVVTLLKKHPREGLNRIYFSDLDGTIVATLINPETLLLMNTSSQSSLGMISVASTKLSQTIQNVI